MNPTEIKCAICTQVLTWARVPICEKTYHESIMEREVSSKPLPLKWRQFYPVIGTEWKHFSFSPSTLTSSLGNTLIWSFYSSGLFKTRSKLLNKLFLPKVCITRRDFKNEESAIGRKASVGCWDLEINPYVYGTAFFCRKNSQLNVIRSKHFPSDNELMVVVEPLGWACSRVLADAMSSRALHKWVVNGAKPGPSLHLLREQFLLLLYEPWTLWHSAWGGSFSCLVLDVNVKVSAAFTCAAFYCCLIILHLSFVFFTCASGFVCRSRLLELVCMLKSLLL